MKARTPPTRLAPTRVAKTTTQKSSCARMARSLTLARTSPISSGNLDCSGAIFCMRCFTPIPPATCCGSALPSEANSSAPAFGRAAIVYNVIDARQAYLQNVVVAGLRALGYEEQASRSVHFSYEIVALTPRCASELGYTLSEEDAKKPYVEVSGRKGLGVKADDLLDRSKPPRAPKSMNATRYSRRGARRHRARHRHRRAALFPLKIHAHGHHRLRLQRRPQLRGRNRPLLPVRRRPRAKHFPQAARRTARIRHLLARNCGRERGGRIIRRLRMETRSGNSPSSPPRSTRKSKRPWARKSPPSSPNTRSNSRRRSIFSITITTSSRKATPPRRSFSCN